MMCNYCGYPDVHRFFGLKLSATFLGEEPFSNLGLNAEILFLVISAYGKSALLVLALPFSDVITCLPIFRFLIKLVFITPGSISITYIPKSCTSYFKDSLRPSKANLELT